MTMFHNLWDFIYYTLLGIGMVIVYYTEALISLVIPKRFREKSVENDIILITGGARGIGKLVARKLAARGARIVIWDISKPHIADTVEEIKAAGGKCWGYYCNVADRDQIYKTAKLVKVDIGNVTILINNAGTLTGKVFTEMSDTEIERTFKVNVLAHYYIIRAFLDDMMKDNRGHIVTIASVTGMLGMYRLTAYSATKGATISFHEALSAELKTHGYNGIQMTLVCPYYINTELIQDAVPRLIDSLQPDYVSKQIVSGILTNDMLIIIPSALRYLLPLKWYVPAKFFWGFTYNILQGPQTLMKIKFRSAMDELHLDEHNDIVTPYTDMHVQ